MKKQLPYAKNCHLCGEPTYLGADTCMDCVILANRRRDHVSAFGPAVKRMSAAQGSCVRHNRRGCLCEQDERITPDPPNWYQLPDNNRRA